MAAISGLACTKLLLAWFELKMYRFEEIFIIMSVALLARLVILLEQCLSNNERLTELVRVN